MAQTTYSDVPGRGLAGQRADSSGPGPVEAAVLEDDAVAFGTFVGQGTADDQALPLAATTDVLKGFFLLDQTIPEEFRGADTADGDGTVDEVGCSMSLARAGRVLARCEDGCSPGDPLFIRAVAAGDEVAGACRAAADGADCINASSWGTWRTTAAVGELAVLEFDMTGVAADPLD